MSSGKNNSPGSIVFQILEFSSENRLIRAKIDDLPENNPQDKLRRLGSDKEAFSVLLFVYLLAT